MVLSVLIGVVQYSIIHGVKDMRRMMGSHYVSIVKKLLTLITLIFLAVAVMGCLDPGIDDMQARHRRLVNIAEQDLLLNQCGFLPISQAETFYPAP